MSYSQKNTIRERMDGQLYRQGDAGNLAKVVFASPFVPGFTAALLEAVAVYAA